MTGFFISSEGIDGAGKSTQLDISARYLRGIGRRVEVTREPGGVPVAERLRELLLQCSMDAVTQASLMFAARREHLRHRILPSLARGDVVLCDRFTDSTFAYQGAAGADWDELRKLEQIMLAFPDKSGGRRVIEPDLTLWFDIDTETAARRRRVRGEGAADDFERRGDDFFAAVRQGYLRRMKEYPERIFRIDADQNADDVSEQVLKIVRERLNL